MGKTFVQGLVILVAGIVALALNQLLNLGLGSITFGLAVGGVLGLVSDGGPVGRVGAFIVGMIVTMILFVLSVLVLNNSFLGQVLTIVIGIGLITIICALTGGRLPLWAGLMGAVLVAGAYSQAFAANPAGILTELPQYTTQALVPAALGFLAAVFVADKVSTHTSIDEKFDEVAGNAGIQQEPAAVGAPASSGAAPTAPAAAAAAPTTPPPPTTPPVAGDAGPSNPNSEV
jgi:hypothetical protein